jgi:hypothetical protein
MNSLPDVCSLLGKVLPNVELITRSPPLVLIKINAFGNINSLYEDAFVFLDHYYVTWLHFHPRSY